MVYFLKITNPQDETITLYFDNLSQVNAVIEAINTYASPCLFQIYNDEYQAIKKSHGVEL